MDRIIPDDVIAHLREVAHKEKSLDGLLITRHVAQELDIHQDRAREMIRELVSEGKLRPRRVALTDEQAIAVGYLGGCGVICYEWVDQ